MKKFFSLIALLTAMTLLLTGCVFKTEDISADTGTDDAPADSITELPSDTLPDGEAQADVSESADPPEPEGGKTEEVKMPERVEIPVLETGIPSTKTQIELMADSREVWAQEEEFANDGYSYTVTDLDSNGYLELIASNFGGTGHYTYSRIYEVNEDGTELILCDRGVEEGDSEADIVVSSAECYVDLETMTIYYIFYDYMNVSAAEQYTGMRSLTLSDGKITETPLASLTETYSLKPGAAEEVSGAAVYHDADGKEITEEEYLAAADNAYAAYDKHSVSMYWQTFSGEELSSLSSMNRDDLIFMLNQSFGNFAVS